MTEMRELRLPADLCGVVEQKFAARFRSLEDLLVFLLQELSQNAAQRADEAEERILEERLRDLGYI